MTNAAERGKRAIGRFPNRGANGALHPGTGRSVDL